MSDSKSRRIAVWGALILLLLLLLPLVRCKPESETGRTPGPAPVSAPASSAPSVESGVPATPRPPGPDEVLAPATVEAPPRVTAGAVFPVKWTGPGNRDDFVTIVPKEAAEGAYANYREIREGAVLQLTAPIDPGECEVRYVAAQAKKTLGRSAILVTPADVSLEAPAEIVLGSPISVTWTGPANKDDYITLVAKDTPDGKYGNFTYTNKGSPLSVTAPSEIGMGELRYVSGQGSRVLARRTVEIVSPRIILTAPADCMAGSTIQVAWTGPDNAGDYVTIVPVEMRDGLYGNYTNTSAGSPLRILAPIMAGPAELRYMSGQGAKVLARIPIRVVAAEIVLSAPAATTVGAGVPIHWTGPNHPGDYLTIVVKTVRDGDYGGYANTSQGNPATVAAPKHPCEAEIRYMSGQGAKVLARRPITVGVKP